MSINKAIPGDYNVICDVCGFKLKRSQTRKRWDGLLVCDADWEPRHPQDYVKGTPRRSRILDSRPEGCDRFVDGGPIEWDEKSGTLWDDDFVKWENGAWVMWDSSCTKIPDPIVWDSQNGPIIDDSNIVKDDDGDWIFWDL